MQSACRMAGITPAKVDVAEVYDAYAGAELQGIDALGLAGDVLADLRAQAFERDGHLTLRALLDRLGLLAAGLLVEKFWVLCLNRKSRLLKRIELTSGTATAALAHPREVFRAAIRESSTGVVCAHNHPSGDPAPSAPDMHATRMIREASKAVDIDFTDHVILGRPEADPLNKGYFSFREAGIL